MHIQLMDAHFYIFSHWVLDLLAQKPLRSVKSELIPLLVKLQHKKKMKKGSFLSFCLSSSQILVKIPESVLYPNMLASVMSSTTCGEEEDYLGCFAYVFEKHFCFRVNDLQTYVHVNREVSFACILFTHSLDSSARLYISPF